MRVPLSWLRQHCPTSLPAEELADLLTNHGVEIERILRPWADLSGVRVARVLEVQDHPNADRLVVAAVDGGEGERRVVVGVRNMGPGDLVPYAPPGATLPGFEGPLERRELRGVTSDGMLCSPKELGISADHSGILVLDDDADLGMEPGRDLAEALELADAVLDIEVKPNRPDTMSIVGVAREVAAITGEDLRLPSVSLATGPEKAEEASTLEVLDPERCPRYVARVIRGVRPGPSPLPAQIRLAAAGMRPLMNVVDATNYAMLELGQPMHPFDLSLLAGPGIEVRRVAAGERLTTLDGVDRELTDDDLLICDVERPVALAGVMGGASSEVSERTTDVLVESALFEPRGIFRTSRRLKLRTEASIRFERGPDPEGVAPAAERAAALIVEWSGGVVLNGQLDVGEVPERRRVSVRPSRASGLLGVELSSTDVREALGRLRLPVVEEDEERLTVEVPGFRVDLAEEADLVEEVGRMTGYEAVPSTLPGVRQAGGLDRTQRLARRVRDVLAGAGLWEARLWTFVPASDPELFGDSRSSGIRLANPVAEDESSLRTSLLPGLLRAARRNVAHRRGSVRLFEVGTTFVARDGEPEEVARVAAVLTGPTEEEWPGTRRETDFLDAKGVLAHLLDSLGVEGWSLSQFAVEPFHPGRCTQVIVPAAPPIGELGELHPRVAEGFDLPGRVAAFELELVPLLGAASAERRYREISRYPPVHRDLAFVVDRDVPAGAVRVGLVEEAGDLLDQALLFDVYEGDPLPGGKKSLAFSVDFRALDRTLTDDEVEERVRAVADRLRRDVGAELRAG
jgi:phenylalanyl-tRNA synthetase beta chain